MEHFDLASLLLVEAIFVFVARLQGTFVLNGMSEGKAESIWSIACCFSILCFLISCYCFFSSPCFFLDLPPAFFFYKFVLGIQYTLPVVLFIPFFLVSASCFGNLVVHFCFLSYIFSVLFPVVSSICSGFIEYIVPSHH